MPYALLPQRGVIRLSGDDAMPFLQGLVSNDVNRLAPGEAVYTALLSPQGKFLHDFFLVSVQGAILLDCLRARIPDLVQRLTLYRLRAQVTIESLPESFAVAACWGAPAPDAAPGATLVADPRLAGFSWRIYGDVPRLPSDSVGYERHRLEAGLPDTTDFTVDKSLLLEFGFEDLHGVDFVKGCYVGQEVTARSKHRGQVRKFLYRIRAETGDLPAPGTPVLLGETDAGQLLSAQGGLGLVQLRVDEVKKGEGALRCGGVAVVATLPEWVSHVP